MRTKKILSPIDRIAQSDHQRLTQKFLDRIEEEYEDPSLQDVIDLLNAYWSDYAICN